MAEASEAAEFPRRAQAIAEAIIPQELARMERQIHASCSLPDHLPQRFSGLGQWLALRQFAVFEVLFFVGEAALRLLSY